MSYKLKSNSFKTTIHHSLFSEMRFHNKLWKFFHHTEIEDRLSAWANAAKGDMFRLPVEWEMKHDELCVYLPPLPKGYLPFSEINNTPIDDQTKVQLIILLCDALSILNDNDFNIGFLLPESIYFNPDNLSILIDIQPFPTAFPFVNTLTDEYSYQFLSRYSRNFTMARVSDYHAIGLIIQWLFKTIPVYLEPIYYRLLHSPNTYLFARQRNGEEQ